MKLNYKRTLLVGLAFMTISAFWQMYDNVVPLILRQSFELGDTWTGVVMAMDNVIAVLLMPLFGRLSDRCKTPLGRRIPFILGGTAAAIVLMNMLPVMDQKLMLTPFIVVLGLLLVAMSTYRSPAVALMPDVTVKPLRSKANAIINLMGALGGVFVLATTGMLVKEGANGPSNLPPVNDKPVMRDDYTMLFLVVSLLMLVGVVVVALTIRENKLAREAAEEQARLDAASPNANLQTETTAGGKLDKATMRSLILILLSVTFWFMGYNAVTSAFTRYMKFYWNYELAESSLLLMVATIAAVVSYLPVGFISSKIGRKKMIQMGVILLAASFGVAGLFKSFHPAAYVVFCLVGVAWAMINVNSYPMVVEISKSGDVGKYTGYYYTFSMAAQVITPILSGYLLEHVGYYTLMPYAMGMVLISLVTISLTKHGDNKPEPPKSALEAFDVGDD
ncbi:MAG: SLC45 family MFS transporter [Clostridiales bacterium]|nr:SLC45 family MFS transporter [Clostridiales bacterium]